jgi:hypothetical protein
LSEVRITIRNEIEKEERIKEGLEGMNEKFDIIPIIEEKLKIETVKGVKMNIWNRCKISLLKMSLICNYKPEFESKTYNPR